MNKGFLLADAANLQDQLEPIVKSACGNLSPSCKNLWSCRFLLKWMDFACENLQNKGQSDFFVMFKTIWSCFACTMPLKSFFCMVIAESPLLALKLFLCTGLESWVFSKLLETKEFPGTDQNHVNTWSCNRTQYLILKSLWRLYKTIQVCLRALVSLCPLVLWGPKFNMVPTRAVVWKNRA